MLTSPFYTMKDSDDQKKKKKTEENIEHHAKLQKQEQEEEEEEEIYQSKKQKQNDDDDSKLVEDEDEDEDEDDWQKIDYESDKSGEGWEIISNQREKENNDDVKVEEDSEEIDGDDWMENDDDGDDDDDDDDDSKEEAKKEEKNMRKQCYYGKNRYYWETEWDHWIYRREGIKGSLDFPSFCSYGPISIHDPFKWQAVIIGPTDSPYEDGLFFLTIDLPLDYPNSPPSIVFNTKVFHPNIDEDGKIYVSILEEEEWRPIHTIESLLVSICSLLADPDPVDPTFESCYLFRYDWESYIHKAKEWTRIYAMQSTTPSFNI